MNADTPSLWSLVKIPALLTLVITVVRLVGELLGWSDVLFRNNPPDAEDAAPAIVAIWWLVPVFGFWFGLRVRQTTGAPEKLGKAFGIYLLGIAIVAVSLFGLKAMGHIAFEPKKPPQGLALVAGLLVLGTVTTLIGIGRAAVALLFYGILARVPIIVITWLAVDRKWDTHYAKLPINAPAAEGTDLLMGLIMPQIFFWIPYTVIVGGLFAWVGASLGGRGPSRY